MQFKINKIKILSPSPTTFVINVEQTPIVSGDPTSEFKTYVGSGEHCFLDETLTKSKLAHSTTYHNEDDSVAIDAYALFDMNDVLVAADSDSRGTDKPDVNYIIFPSLVEVDDKSITPLRGAINNKNALFGIMPNGVTPADKARPLEAPPSRKYSDLYDNKYSYADDNKEAVVLYSKKNNSTSVKTVLRVTEEYALEGNQLEELYVVQTFPAFNSSGQSLGAHQDIRRSWYSLVNNFDTGILSAASFITPKQTLNSEYSTKKHKLFSTTIGEPGDTSSSNDAYKYMRAYNPVDEKVNMYASGDLFVLNYIESRKLSTGTSGEPFQIQTPYSDSIGLAADAGGVIDPCMQMSATIEPEPHFLTDNIHQHYLPEILNTTDNAFGSGPPTDGTRGSKRALHKANIFDIQLSKYDFINNAARKITAAYENASPENNAGELTELHTTISSNLQKTISNRLQDLVAELIPAHTHLYRVVTNPDE